MRAGQPTAASGERIQSMGNFSASWLRTSSDGELMRFIWWMSILQRSWSAHLHAPIGGVTLKALAISMALDKVFHFESKIRICPSLIRVASLANTALRFGTERDLRRLRGLCRGALRQSHI